MAAPRVVFRCDASVAIGTGHVRRCLSLALALQALGAQCLFVLRDHGLDAAAPLRAHGLPALLLPPPSPGASEPQAPAHAAWLGTPQAVDAADTLAALRSAGWLAADWLVVDHYALDARWHRAVQPVLGGRLAAIDDLGDRPLAVDVLIDHNHAARHADKYAGRLPEAARLLGGPRYALLAPAYAQAPRHMPGPLVHSIGIFMGGVDAPGLALQALAACNDIGFHGEVEVASTSACPHLPALRAAVAARPHTRLSLDQPDLARFFAAHDLQIGAGGGATWERCCLGAPTIALVTADNQREVLQPLQGLGVLAVASLQGGPGQPQALTEALRQLLADAELRRSLADNATRWVDGRGAQRVAAALLDLPFSA